MDNKQKLITLATGGALRPYSKTTLGLYFIHAVNPRHKIYDYRFAKEMMTLAPHWFYYKTVLGKRKENVFNLISDGKTYRQFEEKTSRFISVHYRKDPIFKAVIDRLAPKFFPAISGAPVPKCGGKMYMNLKNYAEPYSRSFDPDFRQPLKSMAPHWLSKAKGKTRMEGNK